MSENITPINPGRQKSIFDDGHLIQIQHKGTCIDIVDHHKELGHEHPHTVTRVDRNGLIDTETGW